MQYVICKTSHSTGAIFCKYIIVHFNQKRSQNTPSKCISICVKPCYNTNYLHTYNVDANSSGPFLDLVCNFNFEIQLVCKLLRKRSVVLNCYCSALHYTQVCFVYILVHWCFGMVLLCLTVEDDNSFSLPKKRNIFSSCFQYSERAIHSTERNFTSAERS